MFKRYRISANILLATVVFFCGCSGIFESEHSNVITWHTICGNGNFRIDKNQKFVVAMRKYEVSNVAQAVPQMGIIKIFANELSKYGRVESIVNGITLNEAEGKSRQLKCDYLVYMELDSVMNRTIMENRGDSVKLTITLYSVSKESIVYIKRVNIEGENDGIYSKGLNNIVSGYINRYIKTMFK